MHGRKGQSFRPVFDLGMVLQIMLQLQLGTVRFVYHEVLRKRNRTKGIVYHQVLRKGNHMPSIRTSS
jgi:hypothetical protein